MTNAAICHATCTSPTIQDGCTSCRPGFKPPSCCECDDLFTKNSYGRCVSAHIEGNKSPPGCPPGKQDINGKCEGMYFYPHRIIIICNAV